MARALPVEDILHILELAVSSQAVSDRDAQETLLAKCGLVSRQFRGFAQPLLWRVFRPKENQLHLAVKVSDLANNTVQLRLCDEIDDFQRVFEAVEYMLKLVDFRMEDGGKIKAEQLGCLRRVENLVLNKTELELGSVVLDRLVSLSLHCSPSLELNIATFPRLKALHVGQWDNCGVSALHDLFNFPRLFPQLDMIQVSQGLIALPIARILVSTETPILLTVHFDLVSDLTRPNLAFGKHFQLNAWVAKDTDGHHITVLTRALSRRSPITSLSLPAQLHPSLPPPSSRQPDFGPARDDLLEYCRTHDIAVQWRLDARTQYDDYAVNKNFWEFAKELKRKKAVERYGAARSGSR
ncbi:hypothetical protein JCM8547_008059 [Rhodosporidiobolus lusitaniae]